MNIVAAIAWSFVISFISIRLAKPVAYRAGLVDKPDERKVHSGAVPLVGGIAIFIGVVTALKIFMPNSYMVDLYLISSSIILCLGVLDDKHDLRVSYRMGVQAIAASIMIFGAGLYLENLGYVLGFFPLELGYFGVVVTIIAVIGAINAFNMVDGIDGLAGMLSIVTFSGISVLFFISGNQNWILSVLFISAILAYLTFNLGWPNRKAKKIFMGDAGSMLIGLTVVWLLVDGSQGTDQSFRPVTALWLIALPLMDMAAIMVRRLRKGDSPFKPDRDHLHHICMRIGLSPRQSLVCITMISSVFILFGIVGEYFKIPEAIMFSVFILTFLIYNKALQNIWKLVSWVRSIK